MLNFSQQMSTPQYPQSIKSNKDKTLEYKIIKQIGQGTEGTVYLGQGTNQELVAIKFQYILNQKESLEQLSKNNFTNIINIKEIIYSQVGVYIVMDYADGEFYKYMSTIDYKQKSKREKTELFLQIVKGVQELHQQKMVHRDLKPENILYTIKQNGQLQLKLCDFGLIKYKPQNIFQTANIGTPYYWAPESISFLTQTQYNEKVDIWALGIIWIEMFTGQPLFHSIQSSEEMKELLSKLNQNKINEQIDSLNEFGKEEKEILKQKILQHDQSQRASAEQILLDIQNLHNPKANQFMNTFNAISKQFVQPSSSINPITQPAPPNIQPFPIIQSQFNKSIQPQQHMGDVNAKNTNYFPPPTKIQAQPLPQIVLQQQIRPNTVQDLKGFVQVNQQLFQPPQIYPQNQYSNQLNISDNTEGFKNKQELNISGIPIQQQIDQFPEKLSDLQNKTILISQSQKQFQNIEKNNEINELTSQLQQQQATNQVLINQIQEQKLQIVSMKQEYESLKETIKNFESSKIENEKNLYRLEMKILQQQSNYLKNCLDKLNQYKKNEYQSYTETYQKLIQELQKENQQELEDYTPKECSFKFFQEYIQINDQIRSERKMMKSRIKEHEKVKQLQLVEYISTNKIKIKQQEKLQQNQFIKLMFQLASFMKFHADPIDCQNLTTQLFKQLKRFFKLINIQKQSIEFNNQTQLDSEQLKDMERQYEKDFQDLFKQISNFIDSSKQRQQELLNNEIQIILKNLSCFFEIIKEIKGKFDQLKKYNHTDEDLKKVVNFIQEELNLKRNNFKIYQDQINDLYKYKQILNQLQTIEQQYSDFRNVIASQFEQFPYKEIRTNDEFKDFVELQIIEHFGNVLQITLDQKGNYKILQK